MSDTESTRNMQREKNKLFELRLSRKQKRMNSEMRKRGKPKAGFPNFNGSCIPSHKLTKKENSSNADFVVVQAHSWIRKCYEE